MMMKKHITNKMNNVFGIVWLLHRESSVVQLQQQQIKNNTQQQQLTRSTKSGFFFLKFATF